MSSTCFEHPSVHPQEDLYMQFYGISFKFPYRQSGRWKDVLDTSLSSTLSISIKYQTYPAIVLDVIEVLDTQYQVQVQISSIKHILPSYVMYLILSIKYVKYKYQAHPTIVLDVLDVLDNQY